VHFFAVLSLVTLRAPTDSSCGSPPLATPFPALDWASAEALAGCDEDLLDAGLPLDASIGDASFGCGGVASSHRLHWHGVSLHLEPRVLCLPSGWMGAVASAVPLAAAEDGSDWLEGSEPDPMLLLLP
jgi:hypothetical protein